MICKRCKEHYGRDDSEGICPTCYAMINHYIYGCLPSKKELKKLLRNPNYNPDNKA
jgi:predicted amidophosphoribosyltransferase